MRALWVEDAGRELRAEGGGNESFLKQKLVRLDHTTWSVRGPARIT